MRRFILAFQFLTIIPLTKKLTCTEEDLGKSMLYFPLVGFAIGGCLVATRILLSSILPAGVVDALLVMLLVVITGSMHLDALADTTDAVASGKDREGKLRVMKDTSVGAMGVVSICLVIVLKYVMILALPPSLKNKALFLMPVLGRWSQVMLAYSAEYAGLTRGLGFPFTEQVTVLTLILASFLTGVIAIALFFVKGMLVAAGVVVFMLLYSLFFKRICGGVTGDILGAATEITEVLVLLLLLALIKF
jgi:adenosylcobinamide-GDP ribazoletransferase